MLRNSTYKCKIPTDLNIHVLTATVSRPTKMLLLADNKQKAKQVYIADYNAKTRLPESASQTDEA